MTVEKREPTSHARLTTTKTLCFRGSLVPGLRTRYNSPRCMPSRTLTQVLIFEDVERFEVQPVCIRVENRSVRGLPCRLAHLREIIARGTFQKSRTVEICPIDLAQQIFGKGDRSLDSHKINIPPPVVWIGGHRS